MTGPRKYLVRISDEQLKQEKEERIRRSLEARMQMAAAKIKEEKEEFIKVLKQIEKDEKLSHHHRLGVKDTASPEEIEKQYRRLQHLFKEEEKYLKIFEESYKAIVKDITQKKAIMKARSIASRLKRVLMGEYISKHEKEVIELIEKNNNLSVKNAKILAMKQAKAQGRSG